MKNNIIDKMNQGREFRSLMLTPSKEEDMIVEGYASTFNEPYVLYEDDEIKIMEEVDKDAFNYADLSDVIMQYNHKGRVYARNKNKTLELSTDNKGFFIRANLGLTDIGKQLYQEIKGGYTDKMSFSFMVEEEKRNSFFDEEGRENILRIITKIKKVYDVSAVSIPANDMTYISARNFSDGVIAKIRAERLECLKKKTKLKLKLGEF